MGLAVRASYYDREEEAAAAAGNGGVAGACCVLLVALFDDCGCRRRSLWTHIYASLFLHKTGIAGTPLYMAPEVAALPHHTTTSKPQHQPPHQSSNIDPTKGDVYAAALVLWFLLYRRHPLGEYAGQGRHELAAKVRAKT